MDAVDLTWVLLAVALAVAITIYAWVLRFRVERLTKLNERMMFQRDKAQREANQYQQLYEDVGQNALALIRDFVDEYRHLNNDLVRIALTQDLMPVTVFTRDKIDLYVEELAPNPFGVTETKTLPMIEVGGKLIYACHPTEPLSAAHHAAAMVLGAKIMDLAIQNYKPTPPRRAWEDPKRG